MNNTIKINLYGGPGSGKSTLAAEIYALLKKRSHTVELVREYAKELVYDELDMKKLDERDRIIILGEQFRREKMLEGKVEYLISDSPMLLTAFFHKQEYAKDVVIRHLKTNEVHIWVKRPESFEVEGRSHSEEESKKIDQEMLSFLSNCSINLHILDGSLEERGQKVLDLLKL
jgi:nicotinamide riboside kinase